MFGLTHLSTVFDRVKPEMAGLPSKKRTRSLFNNSFDTVRSFGQTHSSTRLSGFVVVVVLDPSALSVEVVLVVPEMLAKHRKVCKVFKHAA